MTEPLKPDELAAIVARAEAAQRRVIFDQCNACPDHGGIRFWVQGETTYEALSDVFDFLSNTFRDVPALADEVTRLNERLAAVCEKAEKLKEAAKGRDFTLELERAITDLAAVLKEK